MMEKLTYKQAYDKIIQAYFRDEIRPFQANFCFCGTLSDGYNWDKSGYSYGELVAMESALLLPFDGISYNGYKSIKATNFEFVYEYENSLSSQDFEEKIFAGMSAALEVLKQIHKDRGENVEDFQFTKRELV